MFTEFHPFIARRLPENETAEISDISGTEEGFRIMLDISCRADRAEPEIYNPAGESGCPDGAADPKYIVPNLGVGRPNDDLSFENDSAYVEEFRESQPRQSFLEGDSHFPDAGERAHSHFTATSEGRTALDVADRIVPSHQGFVSQSNVAPSAAETETQAPQLQQPQLAGLQLELDPSADRSKPLQSQNLHERGILVEAAIPVASNNGNLARIASQATRPDRKAAEAVVTEAGHSLNSAPGSPSISYHSDMRTSGNIADCIDRSSDEIPVRRPMRSQIAVGHEMAQTGNIGQRASHKLLPTWVGFNEQKPSSADARQSSLRMTGRTTEDTRLSGPTDIRRRVDGLQNKRSSAIDPQMGVGIGSTEGEAESLLQPGQMPVVDPGSLRQGSFEMLPADIEAPGAMAIRQVGKAIVECRARGKEAVVRLMPEVLGAVQFRIAQDSRAVVIAITAEIPETLSLLRRNVDALISELNSLGVENAVLDFSSSGNSQNDASPDGRNCAANRIRTEIVSAPQVIHAGTEQPKAHPHIRF
ncbi:flagellar hook-length control protein FliK [Paracoccus sp. SCSIO 75233]|uniref:flagellar hook-length control protein FliK n=1 Tax=Paracoccus sp. SCSIO 75233 TaxID=3017782 RepID=UPI0022F00D52|nr:flagellar hook-length control protein FliK [Paracoccus sp. SCSIO 75233]WBU53276.1 flagellar hook-length control protein FliK [Paracoccus sp. SCSIO 75233]